MRAERAKLSRHAAVATAIDYMLPRWGAFTQFLHHGRNCLTNNAAERALRGVARKSWLFAGSERGAERAALMYTLNGHSPDQAAEIILFARCNHASARQLIKVLAGADIARTRCQWALGLAFPPVD